MHVREYFDTWVALDKPYPERKWKEGVHHGLGPIRRAIYSSLMVQLDTITASNGVNLKHLIREARDSSLIGHELYQTLAERITVCGPVLHKVRMQRNMIYAHRSEDVTYGDVVRQFPISREELTSVVEMYGDVSCQLYEAVGPFPTADGHVPNVWPVNHHTDHAIAFRAALTEPVEPTNPPAPPQPEPNDGVVSHRAGH